MKGARRAFLLGLREDGSPTCHPMTAVMVGDQPSFNSYRKSVKIRNFLRDPRAAAVLFDGWQVAPSTADMRKGFMEETPPPETPDVREEAVADSLLTVPDSVKARVQRRVDTGKRIYFRLRPED
jgi:hypothetical protein